MELCCDVAPDVPHNLLGDPDRLRQILVNLLSNAIKFTERGHVLVKVARVAEGPTDSLLHFSVSDTGIGIPEDRLPRLFQSFSQADSSTTRRYGGTGLGLVLCKHLAQLFGGKVGVDSLPSQGSTFWFTARLTAAPAAGRPQSEVESKAGLRVLVVDDNAVNREIVAANLQAWGFDASLADSGTRALAILDEARQRQNRFDLAILDMQMPEMDGRQLAAEMRCRTDSVGVPLLILTSMSDPVHADDMARLGIHRVLTKPVRQSRLFDAMMDALADPSVAASRGDAETRPLPAVCVPSRRRGRVLLAEDNAINQLVASEILRKLGHECQVANNGREAVELTRRERFDCLLMDCHMPVLDGFAATRQIREDEAARASQGPSSRLPIIALTANAIKGDREVCLAAGMDDYLAKPIQVEVLCSTLDRWLGEPDDLSMTNASSPEDSTQLAPADQGDVVLTDTSECRRSTSNRYSRGASMTRGCATRCCGCSRSESMSCWWRWKRLSGRQTARKRR